MITVIIAGGSGTRLWPLSTSSKPKQLIKLVGDHTMLRSTYERSKLMSEDIYIVPEISHSKDLKAQFTDLADDHFIVEPTRRGTANCIIASLVHISRHHDHDEPIAFLSHDHHVRDAEGFKKSFEVAADVSTKHQEIVLIGIEPTFASTGFGYIERDGELDDVQGVYHVESFKEKPDFETATHYMQSGNYLWNCGYFVGSVNTFVKALQAYAPDLYATYQKLLAIDDPHSKEYEEAYLALENEVIDIALIEKDRSLLVVPATFDWMDVGNFKDLHEANDSDPKGNHLRGDNIHDMDVENAYIRNEDPDKHVAVIGLDNIVVVNTKDGILVARKDLSHRVGDIAKKIQAS